MGRNPLSWEYSGTSSWYQIPSKSQLRKFLKAYCASRGYLKAIVQENWRYGLNGEKVEEIAQEHKDYALKQLEYNKGAVKN